MVANKIKTLRQASGMTQTAVGKALGNSRAAVNAWEMGISVPSTQYVVELANIFRVSTDYLLGMKTSAAVSVEGLTKEDVEMVYALINHLWRKNHIPGEY